MTKERTRVKELREVEEQIQLKWNEAKAFEEDAPETKSAKYMTTFPFPYMNGRLHLGHTFTLSKCEFAASYHRLRGQKCLFPFAFHCTGMPIKACADKLKREMQLYGFPPAFPSEDDDANKEYAQEDESAADALTKDKAKGKKSKAVAKTVVAKFQWQIMQSLGLSDEEIAKFAEAEHWLTYFPEKCMLDMRKMGLKVDWRRAFITTDINPYFDSFVQWQFRKLREAKLIDFGKRYTIYSPKDGQPCMDHDRSAGEGVGPQEYVLVKMQVVDPLPKVLAKVGNGKPIFLVAATLRPETMYGQTNCFLHPDIEYSAFYVGEKQDQIFVATQRAARNMAYQGMSPQEGHICFVDGLQKIKGTELLGCALRAPLTSYATIYALPMLTIKDDKGTGVVTSVPSDAPDDYAALMDLKKKKPLREKYNIADEMVLPFEPIPIMDVPEYGKLAAVHMCQKLGITSQNDRKKLEEAKKEVYLKGFYQGVMLVGDYKGQKTEVVKKRIQEELIQHGQACKYVEPEKKVTSRSGDECVVALCDQWYLNYGKPEWKQAAKECLARLNTYSDEVRRNFEHTIDWLHEYACSRSYGLGSKVPWDPQYLIESLSDSTIYNAYYAVSHLLQKDIFGSEAGLLSINADQLNDNIWDYIFLDRPYDAQTMSIPEEKLQKMRQEFEFWYPVDMRASGKDLIQNHLTYYIFNHVAIWKDRQQLWPVSIRANGHLLLNNEKMSKNTGNFLTLYEAIELFSSDGMRLALADAGDAIEDANFMYEMADAGVLRLHAFLEWVKQILGVEWKVNKSVPGSPTKELKQFKKSELRRGNQTFADQIFCNEMNRLVALTSEHFEQTFYKEALKTGFFEFQLARDMYRQLCGSDEQMSEELIRRFIETQAIILSPICPHLAERIWSMLGKSGLIVNANWPVAGPVDSALLQQSDFIHRAVREFRLRREAKLNPKKKDPKKEIRPPKSATIYIAKKYPSWKEEIINQICKIYEAKGNSLPDNRTILEHLGQPKTNEEKKERMPFVQLIRDRITENNGGFSMTPNEQFDQEAVLSKVQEYLLVTLQLEELKIVDTNNSELTPPDIAKSCSPGAPMIVYDFGTSG